MLAITLHQPWATFIAEGIKTIETRDWPPHRDVIGTRIGLHAGKKKVRTTSLDHDTIQAILEIGRKNRKKYHDLAHKSFPKGCIVATAVLVDVGQVMSVRDESNGNEVWVKFADGERLVDVDPYGDFSVGRYLWYLDDIQKVDPPIEATGRQKFWNWEDPR